MVNPEAERLHKIHCAGCSEFGGHGGYPNPPGHTARCDIAESVVYGSKVHDPRFCSCACHGGARKTEVSGVTRRVRGAPDSQNEGFDSPPPPSKHNHLGCRDHSCTLHDPCEACVVGLWCNAHDGPPDGPRMCPLLHVHTVQCFDC